jgi:NAD-dependent deacetylase
MTSEIDQKILAAARLIRSSRYTVALTGAGISTPSGIPDFRSQGSGLWTKNDPMRVASLSAFRHRPQDFFDWLRPLAITMLQAGPNPAHRALADLEAMGFLQGIVTQNIDYLHQQAGSREVVEVHGTASSFTCPRCHAKYESSVFLQTFITEQGVPRCPACDAIVKPDIVMFEEALPMDAWRRAENHFLKADLVLVVGSSLEVTPVATLPLYALDRGAKIIINTLSSTYLDGQAIKIEQDVATALPAIVDTVRDLASPEGC